MAAGKGFRPNHSHRRADYDRRAHRRGKRAWAINVERPIIGPDLTTRTGSLNWPAIRHRRFGTIYKVKLRRTRNACGLGTPRIYFLQGGTVDARRWHHNSQFLAFWLLHF